MLCGLRDAFSAHGHACLGGVIHHRAAKRLVSNCPGFLHRELGADGAKQFADAGHEGHGGGIKSGLRDGRAKCSGTTGFLQRLAGIHLTGKVGARELRGIHTKSSGGTKASSDGRGDRSGEGGEANSSGGCHVWDGAAQRLFELQPRCFGPALFGGFEAFLSRSLATFVVLFGRLGVHQPRLTGGQRGFAFQALQPGRGCGLETRGVT